MRATVATLSFLPTFIIFTPLVCLPCVGTASKLDLITLDFSEVTF